MRIFGNLMGSIRSQPGVAGPWLRDHLAKIAPFDGSPQPPRAELERLMDELDQWVLHLYHNESGPDYWRATLNEWRRVSQGEALAAAALRFGDRLWVYAESRRRLDSSGGEKGLGIAFLHDEMVSAGVIPGPGLVKSERKLI